MEVAFQERAEAARLNEVEAQNSWLLPCTLLIKARHEARPGLPGG